MRYLIFFMLFSSIGISCERFQAQVLITGRQVISDGYSTCKAFIEREDVKIYNLYTKPTRGPWHICPLEMNTVIDKGIDFDLDFDHRCIIPEVISGVLEFDGKKIILEESN